MTDDATELAQSSTADTATSANTADAAAPAMTADTGTTAPTTPSAASKLMTIMAWTLAVLASMWIAWCTAIGPIMRTEDGSLVSLNASNAFIFFATFAVAIFIIWVFVRLSRPHKPWAARAWNATLNWLAMHSAHRWVDTQAHTHPWPAAINGTPTQELLTTRQAQAREHIDTWITHARAFVVRMSDRWWKIFVILLVVWLWVPASLFAAFGADLRSQAREFSWAWNQWTGLKQPYIGFFSFVPMDIYPTAHYLWPDTPTFLSDQHNIVLTLIYGSTMAFSRYLTGTNDLGILVLAIAQWVFAAFCISSLANRFFNLPWLTREQREAQPSYMTSHALSRIIILVFFAVCPLVLFSTISLTKSPLFAFAFAWWFGTLYELAQTRTSSAKKPERTRTKTIMAIIISCVVMLISAKYAWYILLADVVLLILADRKRFKLIVLTMLVPTILVHGAVAMAIDKGLIINGDPIESRGLQVQMIARVAKYDPDSIPQSAKDKLEPIFNLDQMAAAYKQQDADPVKSSGIQSKKVSYKWRSVTQSDLDQLNSAWLEIVEASPVVALDALCAESYGYFDVFDAPYVSMTYYLNNSNITEKSTWIGANAGWRNMVADAANAWSNTPFFGMFVHGNFYVVMTLLLGAAEVVLKRWRTLAWHMPLLLLMGVMITSPANNFERHMLPIVFVFGFMVLTFWRESMRDLAASRSASATVAADSVDGNGIDTSVLESSVIASDVRESDAVESDAIESNVTDVTEVVATDEADLTEDEPTEDDHSASERTQSDVSADESHD